MRLRPTRSRLGHTTLARATGIAAFAICAALVLSGCGPTNTNASPQKSQAASHAPEPTASPVADPAANALFTISAKVRSSTGATISIQLVAHPPIAAKDSASQSASAEFLDQCSDNGQAVQITQDTMSAGQGILLRSDLTSSTSGQDFVSPLNLYLGGVSRATAVSGSGIIAPPSTNGCYGLYSWSQSGSAHAITEFENDDASADLTQWRYGIYGFAVQEGANATIEGCTIKLSPQALSAGLNDVPGWVASDTSGTTCATGYIGE
ncbi:MAG: hypothetical protein ABI053_05135 [Lacisediminihabitans sp.]